MLQNLKIYCFINLQNLTQFIQNYLLFRKKNQKKHMSTFCLGNTKINNDFTLQDFINNLQFCPKHNRRSQFICLQQRCERNLLLCVDCIKDHNGHKFQTVQKFLSGQNFERLKLGNSPKHKHFDDLAKLVKKKLSQIQASVIKEIQGLRNGIDASMHRLKQINNNLSIQNQKIDKKIMLQIKKYLQTSWTYTRCQKMKQCFDKVLNAVQDSYINITQDLITFIQNEDWQQIKEPDYFAIQERYFRHLHNHKEKVLDFYRFDVDAKATNIKIKEGRKQAHYLRNSPSTPFVLCDNYIIPQKNKWIIEVSNCESQMLFFNASIIYIGICKPDTAKRMMYAALAQGGRGAYMIGSNGWAYHHSNPALDRQDIVGFTFGSGDKILVQIDFSKMGKIKFKKLGRIYDNKFEMSLDLSQSQMNNLKPCVGFHDDIGVEVKIINID